MSSLSINQGTNAAINFDLNGTINTQVVGLGYGTLSTLGTLPNLPNGSINVTAGTIATLGTMGTLGLVNTVTTLSNLTNGSIKVTAGTGIVTGGSIAVTAGTIASVGTIGTLGLGTVQMTSGTISVLPNLPQGSIQVTAGTIASVGTLGTIGLGTFVPQQSAGTSGTWTSATAQNTALTINTVNYPTVNVMISQTAGVTGGSITFEGQDPLGNWYPVEMMATNGAQTVTTYALQAATNVAFQMNVAGFGSFRARLSGAITGTATVNPTIVGNASASEWAQYITGIAAGGNIIGNIGTISSGTIAGGTINSDTVVGGTLQNLNFGTISVGDGTNTANILKSDATAAGQNAVMVAPTYLEQSFSITSVSTTTAIDVSNYSWFSVHITSQGTSARISWQGSNDNVNWVSVQAFDMTSTTGNGAFATSTLNSGNIWNGPLAFRYFRLSITGITGGTSAGKIEFYTSPKTGVENAALQFGAWNIGTLGTLGLGTMVNAGGTAQVAYPSFSYYSGAGTTTISTSAGILHTVTVGSLLGAGTLYNSAGTSLAIIGAFNTPSPQSFQYDVAYGSLTFAGTGAGNVTIVYK